MAEASIKLINLSTGYSGKAVTSGINATINPGELTCLLGPNGAGKSTLLKTLCAFIKPLAGEITIAGENLKNLSPRKLARYISVVLTQRPATINTTVAELVGIGRSPYTSFFGGLDRTDREIVDHAIEMVGIENLRNRNVSTLSDGERQKALIAKAIAQHTPVIFLDEPTAFLDFPSKVEIMQLLYSIAKTEKKTIFMSTHDLEIALQIADRLWLLDKSLGLTMGTPAELASDGAISTYFTRPFLSFDPATMRFVYK